MDEVGAFEAKTHLPKLLDRISLDELLTLKHEGHRH